MLVRTNRGETPGEVGRIASGGERSRIHLGLSVLAAPQDGMPLLLFDEIDAGVGGETAHKVGEFLHRAGEGGGGSSGAGSDGGAGRPCSALGFEVVPSSAACALALWGRVPTNTRTHRMPINYRMRTSAVLAQYPENAVA